jgi:hypothetical protein
MPSIDRRKRCRLNDTGIALNPDPTHPMKSSVLARYVLVLGLLTGILRAAVGEVTPLNRGELSKVEAMLAKNLKGKPAIKSGEKEEIDGGWKITCVASVGSGGDFVLVLNSEKSMTLGTIVSQKPNAAAPAKKA